ncbi:MAG: SDR family NAD(P)-dependent oxidoreductase, partial [Clostridia bacterium]
MKETCLITGAIGHLGPVVVKKLIEEGYAVKVFARQNSPIEVLSGLEVEFAFGDITDRKSIDNALLNVDIVIHAAALIDISNLKVEEMKQVNFVGTKNILDASIEKGIKKFV